MHTRFGFVKMAFMAWAVAMVFGCAAVDAKGSKAPKQIVGPGDEIRVNYTCRILEGPIVATTDEKVAEDSSLAKAPAFKPPRTPGAASLVAGQEQSFEELKDLTFEKAIVNELTGAVLGLEVGKHQRVSLVADDLPGGVRHDWTSVLNRFPTELKERTMLRKYFGYMFGEEPEEGRVVYSDRMPWYAVEVLSADEQEARIRLSAPLGMEVDTPFGPATIRDQGDHFVMEYDHQEGQLLRVGDQVARVAAVDEKTFTLDFTNPFGRETLSCDVQVEGIDKKGEVNRDVAQTLEAAMEKARSQGGQATVDLEEVVGVVQKGDLVKVDFTATLKDDRAIAWTTDPAVDHDESRKKVPWYPAERPRVAPVDIVAGAESIIAGLGTAVIGMAQGESKTVTLLPEETYGARDESKVRSFSCIKRTSKTLVISKNDLLTKYRVPAMAGRLVRISPYFETRITKVDGDQITLTSTAADGKQIEEAFGTTTVRVDGDVIETRLEPRIGAAFSTGDHLGRISSTDGETFKVDLNHPLAGETYALDVKVVSLDKASSFRGIQLAWYQGYDEMLAAAKKDRKPLVMVFYTPQCPWCKKLFNETLEDARIKVHKEDFVWGKVNGEGARDLARQYRVSSYPTTFIVSPEGDVVTKLDGFKTAEHMKRELERVLASQGTRLAYSSRH